MTLEISMTNWKYIYNKVFSFGLHHLAEWISNQYDIPQQLGEGLDTYRVFSFVKIYGTAQNDQLDEYKLSHNLC